MSHEAEHYPPIYTIAEKLVQLRDRASSALAQLSFQSLVCSGVNLIMISHRNLPGHESRSILPPEPTEPSPEDVSRFLRGIDRHLATAALGVHPLIREAEDYVYQFAEKIGEA